MRICDIIIKSSVLFGCGLKYRKTVLKNKQTPGYFLKGYPGVCFVYMNSAFPVSADRESPVSELYSSIFFNK